LRVQALSTFYSHLGEHMGYRQVWKRLDPARVQVTERLVVKDSPFIPAPRRALRRLTRNWFSRPPRLYMLEDWLAERGLLRRLGDGAQADLVQYLDGEHSLGRGPGWIARLPHPPKVLALFHLLPEQLETLLDRDTIHRLDAVLTLSPEQADWFRSWVDPARVHLLHHGIDDAFFHPAPEGPPAAPPWRVLTVGTNHRDFTVLGGVARAFLDRPEVEFHAVCRPPEDFAPPPNLRLHRGLSDLELAELYRSAHVAFLPLRRAVASNGLQEGMASGLPLLTTDLPAVRHYTGESAAVFLPRADVDAAVAALRRLLADPARCRELGAHGRRRAEQTNWQSAADALLALYGKVAGR
jgi:glycosyltransferase involved in cell wall biosynthesis